MAATADPGEGRRVSPSLLAVVEDISQHEPASIAEIVTRTGLTQSLVSRIVGTLRDANVVRVQPDPEDGRRIQVRIDDQTRSQLFADRGNRRVAAALQESCPHLRSGQVGNVERLLDRVALELRVQPARGTSTERQTSQS